MKYSKQFALIQTKLMKTSVRYVTMFKISVLVYLYILNALDILIATKQLQTAVNAGTVYTALAKFEIK